MDDIRIPRALCLGKGFSSIDLGFVEGPRRTYFVGRFWGIKDDLEDFSSVDVCIPGTILEKIFRR